MERAMASLVNEVVPFEYGKWVWVEHPPGQLTQPYDSKFFATVGAALRLDGVVVYVALDFSKMFRLCCPVYYVRREWRQKCSADYTERPLWQIEEHALICMLYRFLGHGIASGKRPHELFRDQRTRAHIHRWMREYPQEYERMRAIALAGEIE